MTGSAAAGPARTGARRALGVPPCVEAGGRLPCVDGPSWSPGRGKLRRRVVTRRVLAEASGGGRVSEAPSYGKPAILYDLKCSGSQAYLRLASEVIKRERKLAEA